MHWAGFTFPVLRITMQENKNIKGTEQNGLTLLVFQYRVALKSHTHIQTHALINRLVITCCYDDVMLRI